MSIKQCFIYLFLVSFYFDSTLFLLYASNDRSKDSSSTLFFSLATSSFNNSLHFIKNLGGYLKSSENNAVAAPRVLSFQEAFIPFEIKVTNINRNKSKLPIYPLPNFPPILATTKNAPLSGDLKWEVFKRYHDKEDNIYAVEGIPIKLYEQVVSDLTRDHTIITKNQQVIFDSTSYSTQDEEQKIPLIRELFFTLLDEIKQQIHASLHVNDQSIYELIHMILASRTQTFTFDGLSFIYEQVHPHYDKDTIILSGYNQNNVIEIQDGIIKASTNINFKVINVNKVTEKAPFNLKLLRSMNFYISSCSYRQETFSLNKI